MVFARKLMSLVVIVEDDSSGVMFFLIAFRFSPVHKTRYYP